MPAKVLILVRHAEAAHNERMQTSLAAGLPFNEAFLSMASPDLEDARLTDAGEIQAGALNSKLKRSPWSELFLGTGLVLASPLSRTLKTAELAFDGISCGKMIAFEGVRERMSTPRSVSGNGRAILSERRRSRSTIQREFPGFDFSMLASDIDEQWTAKGESRQQARDRALEALTWIWSRSEDQITVVSHGGFLANALLKEEHGVLELDGGAKAALRWSNAQARAFQLSKLGNGGFRIELITDSESSSKSRL